MTITTTTTEKANEITNKQNNTKTKSVIMNHCQYAKNEFQIQQTFKLNKQKKNFKEKFIYRWQLKLAWEIGVFWGGKNTEVVLMWKKYVKRHENAITRQCFPAKLHIDSN